MKRDEVSATSSMSKDDADTPIGDTTGATCAKTGASARPPVRATRNICMVLLLSSRQLIGTVANAEGNEDALLSYNLFIFQHFATVFYFLPGE